jgi:hypothetical protein
MDKGKILLGTAILDLTGETSYESWMEAHRLKAGGMLRPP